MMDTRQRIAKEAVEERQVCFPLPKWARLAADAIAHAAISRTAEECERRLFDIRKDAVALVKQHREVEPSKKGSEMDDANLVRLALLRAESTIRAAFEIGEEHG